MIFEMGNETQEAKVYRPSGSDLSNPLGQIARYVAATGQILNIGDVTTWLKKDVVQAGSEPIKSILCMPIVNGQRTVIGVAQLINKVALSILFSFFFFFFLFTLNTTTFSASSIMSATIIPSGNDSPKSSRYRMKVFSIYKFEYVHFGYSSLFATKYLTRIEILQCSKLSFLLLLSRNLTTDSSLVSTTK